MVADDREDASVLDLWPAAVSDGAVNPTASGTPPQVRTATSRDVARAGEVLAEAFGDRPPFTWIEPDPGLRAAGLRALFGVTLEVLHPVTEGTQVMAAGDDVLGVAVWAPPGRWKPSLWRRAQVGPRLVRAVGPRHVSGFANRGGAVDKALERSHPAEPHWYLVALGVAPEAQGQGVGDALVRAGLDRCDAEGVPAYLECLTELEGYYARFGFSRTAEIPMPAGAGAQLSMWRAPESRAGTAPGQG